MLNCGKKSALSTSKVRGFGSNFDILSITEKVQVGMAGGEVSAKRAWNFPLRQ